MARKDQPKVASNQVSNLLNNLGAKFYKCRILEGLGSPLSKP